MKVTKAYKPTPSSELQTGSVVQLSEYDGLNRRIVKQVQNSADWDCTYHYYYNPGGWNILETRNGSGGMMKQQVFGTTYIDELVQIAVNRDPENAYSGTVMENDPEYYFYVAQDANYNVLGVVDQNGVLLERYEYTPYGRRTVYTHGYPLADLNADGVVDSGDVNILMAILNGQAQATQMADLSGDGIVNNQDITLLALEGGMFSSGAADVDPWVSYPALASYRPRHALTAIAPAPLCEFGHQGLMHDEELAGGQIIQNRERFLHARLGRFGQRDPLGYPDGMNHYAAYQVMWGGVDPSGQFTSYLVEWSVTKAADFTVNHAPWAASTVGAVGGFVMSTSVTTDIPRHLGMIALHPVQTAESVGVFFKHKYNNASLVYQDAGWMVVPAEVLGIDNIAEGVYNVDIVTKEEIGDGFERVLRVGQGIEASFNTALVIGGAYELAIKAPQVLNTRITGQVRISCAEEAASRPVKPISVRKQARHAGDWAEAVDPEALIREAYQKGVPFKGRADSIIYETGQVVGKNGETQVIVRVAEKNIHGHPAAKVLKND